MNPPSRQGNPACSRFETDITVRPSDIDANGHVHQSVYLDYLLFARVDQMERCYGMSVQEFFDRGLSWAARTIRIEYLKPVFFGETVTVRTWVEEIGKKSVTVGFQILKKKTGELSAEGCAVYVLIDARSGKPADIPEDVRAMYSI